jgi:hypothetical protein
VSRSGESIEPGQPTSRCQADSYQSTTVFLPGDEVKSEVGQIVRKNADFKEFSGHSSCIYDSPPSTSYQGPRRRVAVHGAGTTALLAAPLPMRQRPLPLLRVRITPWTSIR